MSRARFRVGPVLVVGGALLLVAGCGEGSAAVSTGGGTLESTTSSSQVSGVYDGFRLVGEEAVGLNGVENQDRPPLRFLLLASADEEGAAISEEQMVESYVEQLEGDGWGMAPFDSIDEWWTAEGNDGVAFVRVGPASRFHELAKISEGYSRTSFRNLAAANPGPLIVVSIDPAG